MKKLTFFVCMTLLAFVQPGIGKNNQPPQITQNIVSHLAFVGQTFVVNLNASDPDGDNLYFKVLQGSPGMSVDAQGVLSWQPTLLEVGVHRVKVQVSDGDLKTVGEYRISVAGPATVRTYSPVRDEHGVALTR